MKKFFILFSLILTNILCFSQNIGISETLINPDPSAILELKSNERGFLITRLSTQQRDAIAAPAQALMIFNTTTKCLEIFVQGWHSIWCHDDTTTVFCESPVIYNGYSYTTIQIGNQCWFAENLRTTQYNNGSNIQNITDNAGWGNTTSGAYCWYNNDYNTYGTVYGALYNWYAGATGNLCPVGWRVPTDNDWKTMEMYLGMSQSEADATGWRGTDQGKQIKDVSMNGSNTSGFTAIAGGWRVPTYFSSVNDIGAYFWTSSENTSSHAWMRLLHKPKYAFNDPDKIYRINSGQDGNKLNGMSVRCVKD
jgi:uncharacterized protein (TIGR02145 family)